MTTHLETAGTPTAGPDRPAVATPHVRRRRWQRLRLGRDPSLVVLALFVFAAIFAPWLTPYSPVDNSLTDSLQPPAWMAGGTSEHLLGTDSFGRDVLTRLIHGARVSLIVVVFSLLIAVVIGTGVGVWAGYAGGKTDAILMRLVDIMFAVPSLLVALVAAVALGPSMRNLVLILGLLIWPNIARLIRGETLALKNNEYVAYAKAIGSPRWRILRKHILPNVMPTLLVAATLEVANVILTEASLSFLGAGLPPPAPSWGVMIDDGRALIATGWWISMFAGLAIVVTVLAFNGFGDWLRDRYDPQTRDL
jgi:ABC-type dipeptide/oligopeptide/nickel transport system permease subunit